MNSPPSYSAAIATGGGGSGSGSGGSIHKPPFQFINHYQTQQSDLSPGTTTTNNLVVPFGAGGGCVAAGAKDYADADATESDQQQQQQLCVVAKMQKSVTITVTPQRSNSMDYLNFEEKRQLIASSLSLSDILHCNPAAAAAAAAAAKEVAANANGK